MRPKGGGGGGGGGGGQLLMAGVQGKVTAVPATAGHSAAVVICATADRGINAAVGRWGRLLRKKYRTKKMAGDLITTKLGYWTGGLPLRHYRLRCRPAKLTRCAAGRLLQTTAGTTTARSSSRSQQRRRSSAGWPK